MNLQPRVLENAFVRLEPFEERHREGVRLALDADLAVWEIMPVNGGGDGFDTAWEKALADPKRIAHAVIRLSDGKIVGTSSYLNIHQEHGVAEIGWTFYRGDVRGGPVNPACKRLMIGNAFEAGARRVAFNVDTRNERSQAAVLKLGAKKEGVIRDHMVTWTGHVRSTAVFSILKDEWPAVRDGLEARLTAFSP